MAGLSELASQYSLRALGSTGRTKFPGLRSRTSTISSPSKDAQWLASACVLGPKLRICRPAFSVESKSTFFVYKSDHPRSLTRVTPKCGIRRMMPARLNLTRPQCLGPYLRSLPPTQQPQLVLKHTPLGQCHTRSTPVKLPFQRQTTLQLPH
jgi:hypothetical protein